jgi:hypothetical protein
VRNGGVFRTPRGRGFDPGGFEVVLRSRHHGRVQELLPVLIVSSVVLDEFLNDANAILKQRSIEVPEPRWEWRWKAAPPVAPKGSAFTL